MDEPFVTLSVETASGTFLRRVMPASILPDDVDPGTGAERATRTAAATWGLPDFVFEPRRHGRGAAGREIGDAIIAVGTLAATVQVKARSQPSSDEARERRWLTKNIEQAARQAIGTIRTFTTQQQGMTLTNQRGHDAVVGGPETRWLPVVVLSHPGVDGYVPTSSAVVLLRRDWEFLFEQLRSTYAVLEYLARVSGGESVALGEEPIRYYQLAAADAATVPAELDPRLVQIGGRAASVPLLPHAPAGHGEDRHQFILRSILEDVAVAPQPEGASRLDVLHVLASLDAVPVGYRAELGRLLMDWLDEVSERPTNVLWRFRGNTWPDRPYLLFGAANRLDETIGEAFSGYVTLRHQQFIELMPERAEITTVGVVLTPRRDGQRPWDTTVVATHGDQGLDPDLRASLESLWGDIGQSTRADP